MTVCCATGNPGKLREFRLAAAQAGVQVETLPGLAEMPPCKETGDTFEANAILKAEYYGRHAPGLLFADDSGLEVDALGGAPGVYSARFAGPGATDEANNQLLLERMRGVRFMVARGSMEYSAVTQPLPVPRRNCGTESSTEAAHSTRVLPTVMSVDPSAVCRNPEVISTGRIWSGARWSVRIFHHEVEKKKHENEARSQQDDARKTALRRGAALRFGFCEFELRHPKRPS